MYKTHPPGFAWHSTYFNHKLLLPNALIKELTELTRLRDLQHFKEDSPFEGNFPVTKADDNIISSSIPSNPSQQARSGFKKKWIVENFIRIFDMAAIREFTDDKYVTRNVKAVMKRFKAEDNGKRLLKSVPADFTAQLQTLKTHYPNCRSFLDYVESFTMLALKQPHAAFYFPPVLLVGPPGVGKTAVVNAVADLVGVTTRQVDLAATTAGMVLGGMSTQWADAKTGIVIDLLRDGDAANPIVILD